MKSVALPIVFASAIAASAAVAQTGNSSVLSASGAVGASKPIGLAPTNNMGIPNVVPPSDIQAGNTNFTEEQVRTRIESAGFKSVSDLKKDDSGVWRATALLGERTAQVAFDYKGNLSAQ